MKNLINKLILFIKRTIMVIGFLVVALFILTSIPEATVPDPDASEVRQTHEESVSDPDNLEVIQSPAETITPKVAEAPKVIKEAKKEDCYQPKLTYYDVKTRTFKSLDICSASEVVYTNEGYEYFLQEIESLKLDIKLIKKDMKESKNSPNYYDKSYEEVVAEIKRTMHKPSSFRALDVVKGNQTYKVHYDFFNEYGVYDEKTVYVNYKDNSDYEMFKAELKAYNQILKDIKSEAKAYKKKLK
jgi:hypothetical protein